MVGVRHETHVLLSPARLIRHLQEHGWSAQELARRSGVSPTTISGVMGGRRISPSTARRIAKALAEVPPIDGLSELMQIEES